MHAIQGGWVGQTYALATTSDAGGKKPRIRRSKEERKTMVESFVKKFQRSNNGKFPSLNLTHKEVGGSFYTVREIVRDIIQENRVLAPPKESLDKHDPAGFLEQHNLVSSPMEHQNNLLTLDRLHIATPISHTVPNSGRQSSPRGDNLKNEKIVDGSEGLEDDTGSDKPLTMSVVPIDHENHVITLQSCQKVNDSLETHGHIDEQNANNLEMVDKTKDAEKLYMKPADMEILSEENFGGQVAISNSTSVVEVFPDSGTVLELDGESGELHEAAGSLEDVANESEKIALTESNLDVVIAKHEEKLNEVTLKLDYEYDDEKEAQNLPEPSREDSKLSTTFSPAPHNGGEPKSSLLDETKLSSSAVQPVSEAPAKLRIESNSQNKTSVKKMDRINLETWKGASKRSTKPQCNPVLELVKAFLSAFVKLWTK